MSFVDTAADVRLRHRTVADLCNLAYKVRGGEGNETGAAKRCPD